MTHTIRRNGQLEELDFELGSGCFDLYGREIFEGDIVSNSKINFPVKFINGALLIFDERNGEGYDLNPHFAQGFEVVGHIGDGKS